MTVRALPIIRIVPCFNVGGGRFLRFMAAVAAIGYVILLVAAFAGQLAFLSTIQGEEVQDESGVAPFIAGGVAAFALYAEAVGVHGRLFMAVMANAGLFGRLVAVMAGGAICRFMRPV